MFNTLEQRVVSIVFKTSNYDLNRDGRKAKYKGYGIIFCEKCVNYFIVNTGTIKKSTKKKEITCCMEDVKDALKHVR